MKENSDPTLLIIGRRGFIGEHLVRVATGSWNVCVTDQPRSATDQVQLIVDVTKPESVRELFERTRPSAVVLLAAISDIDRCEREPAKAWAVNTRGVANVAQECSRIGARLLFTSSAAIFDGLKHSYKEDDPPNPLSLYGQTKLNAERAIADALPSAVVVRMALVLGFSQRRGTNAILNQWIDAWQAGRPVSAPVDEYRNPIDVQTLAKIILHLAEHPKASGVYHIGALDSASRYEMARTMAELMGYSSSLVIPQTGPQLGRAPRGRDHFLLTERIREICDIPLGTTDEVIRRSLNEASKSSL